MSKNEVMATYMTETVFRWIIYARRNGSFYKKIVMKIALISSPDIYGKPEKLKFVSTSILCEDITRIIDDFHQEELDKASKRNALIIKEWKREGFTERGGIYRIAGIGNWPMYVVEIVDTDVKIK